MLFEDVLVGEPRPEETSQIADVRKFPKFCKVSVAPVGEVSFLSYRVCDRVPDAPAEEVAAARLRCPGGRVGRQWSVVVVKQVIGAILQFPPNCVFHNEGYGTS
jgi:hypothetical protein